MGMEWTLNKSQHTKFTLENVVRLLDMMTVCKSAGEIWGLDECAADRKARGSNLRKKVLLYIQK